ncbi:DUF2130 domain-containing protein [Bradyrhizobium sp. AUGA SZCCT0182]|nr:DUF2130 domain-containing protein [Bradyrhizobium sp. AUGA SZCCT0182]
MSEPTIVCPNCKTEFKLNESLAAPLPVAMSVRQSLISLSAACQAGEGQQTKMEVVYQYLTGPRFRHRIEAIVEKFSDMHSDLEKERKATTRLWAKREMQIKGVIESTVGMYGDLQGIAGKSLQEIDGLDMQLLKPPKEDSDSPEANDESDTKSRQQSFSLKIIRGDSL